MAREARTAPPKASSAAADDGAAVRGSSPERLLDILLMFQSGETVTVQQIAERFGNSRSSTYRDIGFLRGRGFIEDDESPGTFRLGPTIEHLANSAGSRRNLAKIARPHLQHLVEETGESVMLTRRSGSRVLLVAHVDSPQMLRVSMRVADNQPLHAGSFAKLLLAHQRTAVIDRVLQRPLRRPGGAVDAGALRAELELIRRRGYAASESEVEPGTRSVSIAVATPQGEVLAALTIAAPASRLQWRCIRRWLPLMRRTAADIVEDWLEASSTQR